jgi:hypothetical protein
MSAGNQMHLDMLQFLEEQRRERYRAFVIHGRPLEGKTTFALKLASISYGGQYLDVLQYIATHPAIAQTIDVIDATALRSMIIQYARETAAKLLLVDEIDFLLHIWGHELTEFKRIIESLSCTEIPAVVGFILQTRPFLEEWKLTNSHGQRRIVRLEGIKTLQGVHAPRSRESERTSW